jgi:predicted ATP-grasp superfamily ATP-dependent carboligase
MSGQEIIVVGTTHHNTLGIIRALGESPQHYRCMLLLYGEHESYLSKSIYVSRVYFVDSANDITDKLLTLAKDEKQILITVTDEAAHQLDLNACRLSQHFHFFKTKEIGQLTCFMDKIKQDKIANHIGLNVPDNYTLGNINYPCLLKPLASISGGKRVVICNNQDEFNSTISKFPETHFQIQQYIQKEKEIVLVGLSINGEVFIPAYVLKHREIYGGTTYSTVRPVSELEVSLVLKSKQLIREIGYEGLFGIEFIYCEGMYYFIEVNLRTDATCYAVAVAGVNLPVAFVMAKQGEDIMKMVFSPVHAIDSMVEYRDFVFVIRDEIGVLRWIRQRNHCRCLYFYSPVDKKPYYINLRKTAELFFKTKTVKLLKKLGIKR